MNLMNLDDVMFALGDKATISETGGGCDHPSVIRNGLTVLVSDTETDPLHDRLVERLLVGVYDKDWTMVDHREIDATPDDLLKAIHELTVPLAVAAETPSGHLLTCPNCESQRLQEYEVGIVGTRRFDVYDPVAGVVKICDSELFYDCAVTDRYECRQCLTEVRLPDGTEVDYV